MGLFTGKPVYARYRHGQDRPPDPSQAGQIARTARLGFCCGLIWLLAGLAVGAEPIRIATYNVSLGRKGPGILARDLAIGTDEQIAAVVGVIATVRPNILLLNDFDYDYGQVALGLFADLLRDQLLDFRYLYAAQSNAGLASGIDLDGDGWLGGPADAQGFGGFSGRQAMAILSQYPLDIDKVRDFSGLLWADLPGAKLATKNGAAFPSVAAHDVQRLSSKGHWDVPVLLPDGRVLHLLVSHATPPVFDGVEDLNGLRNRDEIRFWKLYLDGAKLGGYAARGKGPFAILGDLNADPFDGEGSNEEIRTLLAHPLVQDAKPASKGAVVAAQMQGRGNRGQKGDPALDTVDWDEGRTPGNMRVDYVLPSADLVVTGAGVFWPAPDEPGFNLLGLSGDLSSHHRLVWIDIR